MSTLLAFVSCSLFYYSRSVLAGAKINGGIDRMNGVSTGRKKGGALSRIALTTLHSPHYNHLFMLRLFCSSRKYSLVTMGFNQWYGARKEGWA